jgi:hypothetical protein
VHEHMPLLIVAGSEMEYDIERHVRIAPAWAAVVAWIARSAATCRTKRVQAPWTVLPIDVIAMPDGKNLPSLPSP